jgi:hypothetical protein
MSKAQSARAKRMNQEYSGKEFPSSNTGGYSIYDYLDDIESKGWDLEELE